MPDLYRRFTLVDSLIAAFGVMTSILIQETRRDAAYFPHERLAPTLQPKTGDAMRLSCEGETVCMRIAPLPNRDIA